MSKIDNLTKTKLKTYTHLYYSVQVKLIVKDPTVSEMYNSNKSAVPLHSFVSKVIDGV